MLHFSQLTAQQQERARCSYPGASPTDGCLYDNVGCAEAISRVFITSWIAGAPPTLPARAWLLIKVKIGDFTAEEVRLGVCGPHNRWIPDDEIGLPDGAEVIAWMPYFKPMTYLPIRPAL